MGVEKPEHKTVVYVVKPFTVQDLRKEIRRVLSLSPG
jgi:hypothetical protein